MGTHLEQDEIDRLINGDYGSYPELANSYESISTSVEQHNLYSHLTWILPTSKYGILKKVKQVAGGVLCTFLKDGQVLYIKCVAGFKSSKVNAQDYTWEYFKTWQAGGCTILSVFDKSTVFRNSSSDA